MAKQVKTKSITITEKEGRFSSLFKRIKGESKQSEISALRQLFSNEKARLLNICKTKQPESIYMLAKLLGRDFKAVRQDIRLLEQYGFVELISSHKDGRERLQPIVDVDEIVITVKI